MSERLYNALILADLLNLSGQERRSLLIMQIALIVAWVAFWAMIGGGHE